MGSVSYALSQWVILSACTRFISIEHAGYYSFYTALFTPAAVLSALGMRNASASDVDRNFSDEDYIALQSATQVPLVLFSALMVLIFDYSIIVGASIALAKMIDNASEPRYGNWLRSGYGYRCGLSRILRFVSFLLIFAMAWALGVRGVWLIVTYPISLLLVSSLYDGCISSVISTRMLSKFSRTRSVELARSCAPLGVAACITAATASVPRVVLMGVEGATSVALYSMLVTLISVAALPLTSILQIYMPQLRALLNEEGARGVVMLLTIVYGLVVGSVIILLGARGIQIAYGVEVDVLWNHLALTSVFGIAQFLLVTLTAGLTAVREFKSVLYNSLALLFITSIVSFVFIPASGLTGSIFSNAIGAGSGALLAWIRLRKSLPATKSV